MPLRPNAPTHVSRRSTLAIATEILAIKYVGTQSQHLQFYASQLLLKPCPMKVLRFAVLACALSSAIARGSFANLLLFTGIYFI